MTEVAALTINGDVPDVWDASSFEHYIALADGLTIIETLAMDSDLDDEGEGNRSNDVRSVLRADAFIESSSLFTDGMVLRVQDDAGGLGAIEAMASTLFTADDISGAVVGEIFDEDCIGGPGVSASLSDATSTVSASAT